MTKTMRHTAFTNTRKLLILGTSGILGIDDILACFITGNAFTIECVHTPCPHVMQTNVGKVTGIEFKPQRM